MRPIEFTLEVISSVILVIVTPLVVIWQLLIHAPWLLFVAWALYVLFTAEPKPRPW